MQPLTKPPASSQRLSRAADVAADAVSRHIGVDGARTESYRQGYGRLMKLVYLLTFAILALIAALVFAFVTYVPEDRYFAETSEGARMQMVGLARPVVTQQALFDWSADAASQVLTFGFNDYDQKLSQAQQKFTQDGWVSFANVMANSSFFKNVVSEKQLVTSVPSGTPLLMFEGLSQGQFNWIVEVPLMVTVRSGSLNRSVAQTVRLIIVPVPTAMNPMGIAIDRWISF